MSKSEMRRMCVAPENTHTGKGGVAEQQQKRVAKEARGQQNKAWTPQTAGEKRSRKERGRKKAWDICI
jgi:hypothetical protein